MAENEVVIEISADTTKADRGFKQVQNRMGPMKAQVNQLKTGFAGLGKMLGIVGIGGLSFGLALRSIISTSREVTRQPLFTGFALQQLGDDFVHAFEAIKHTLGPVAKQFGFTALEAEKAYVTIATTSRMPLEAVKKLEVAMAVARISGVGLAEASHAVGQAMLGNVTPLQQIVGLEHDLETAEEDLITRGLEATDVYQRLQATLKTAFQGFVSDIKPIHDFLLSVTGMVSKDNVIKLGIEATLPVTEGFFDLVDFIKKGSHDVSVKAVGSFFTNTVPRWFSAIRAWMRQPLPLRFDAVGTFFTQRLPSWWDELKNGVRIVIKFLWGLMPLGLPDWWHSLIEKTKVAITLIWGWMPWGLPSWWHRLIEKAKLSITLIWGWMPSMPDWWDSLIDKVKIKISFDWPSPSSIPGWIRDLAKIVPGPLQGIIPGRVQGGPASGMTMVGERGPEIVNLPGGSNVIPNHRLAMADAGGGGGITINVYGNVDSEARLQELAEEMARRLNQNGRRGPQRGR